MAVNFIRINLFRQSSVLFPLTSLWNVYRQILIRHNSEDNKGINRTFLYYERNKNLLKILIRQTNNQLKNLSFIEQCR